MKVRSNIGRNVRLQVVDPYNPMGSRAMTVGSSPGSRRIYVGNLGWEVAWQDLKDFFKQVGNVIRADVFTEPSGRSKGCGIVEFSTPHEAFIAMRDFNNVEFRGRPLHIREDREAMNGINGVGAVPIMTQDHSAHMYVPPMAPVPPMHPLHAPPHPPHPSSIPFNGSRRVYVGNLAWEVTWQHLKDHFKMAGNVIRADIKQEPSGRSKGCGIVEFETPQEALFAIHQLHETELLGRLILVREDRMPDAPVNPPATSGLTGTPPEVSFENLAQSRRIYVGNLAWEVAWQDLKDHFKQCGTVVRADVMTEPNGRSKGCGIVEFATAEEAFAAVQELKGSELKGRQIFLREDREYHEAYKIYVGNLSWQTTWQTLKDHFKKVGNVIRADIAMEMDGRSKGFGIVEFENADVLQSALALNSSILDGREIQVREDRQSARQQ